MYNDILIFGFRRGWLIRVYVFLINICCVHRHLTLYLRLMILNHLILGLYCSSRMETGNSVELFQTALGIFCVIDIYRNRWSKSYHPAIEISSGICLGYLSVPEKVNCTADTMGNSDIRRLCSCINKSEYFINHWVRVEIYKRVGLVKNNFYFISGVLPFLFSEIWYHKLSSSNR